MSESNAVESVPVESAPVENQSTEEVVSEETSSDVEASSEEGIEAATEEAAAEIANASNGFVPVVLKVDGEEISVNSQDELLKLAQLGTAGQKRMQESAQLKKELQEFFSALKTNPANVLNEIGLDWDSLNEEYAAKKLEDAAKSPEELEREKMQNELAKLQKELQTKEEKQQAVEFQRLQDHYHHEIDKDISEAIESSLDLPKSPYVVKRMAEAMILGLQNGHDDVRAKDVLPIVKKQIQNEIQEMFGAMPEEVMENAIGKKNLNRLRQRRLKQIKKPVDTANSVKSTTKSNSKKENNAEKMKAKDFFRNLGNR